jgi:hypothetical protein
MSVTSYIPRADADFNAWQNQFAVVLSENMAFWPVDGSLLSAFFDAASAWGTAYNAHVIARQTAEAATRTKDTARDTIEKALRPLVRQIQSLTEVTNADRKNLGITVQSVGGSPIPPPSTAPMVRVVRNERLRQELRISDPSTPTRKAKPKGVIGAEIWVALVDADQPVPKDPSAYRYQSLTTRGTALATFELPQRGKTAAYLLRWISGRGDHGPWSEPATATVAA